MRSPEFEESQGWEEIEDSFMEGIDEEIYFFADETLIDSDKMQKKLPFHKSILKHIKEREKNMPKF